jgi:hypothetical protein
MAQLVINCDEDEESELSLVAWECLDCGWLSDWTYKSDGAPEHKCDVVTAQPKTDRIQ